MSKTFTVAEIPDQSGRIAVVTGANAGLGFETAKALASRGAEVILACRTESKAQAAIEKIQSETPAGKLVFLALDLSDLSSVRAFVAEFSSRYEQLNLLINNAGVMMPPFSKTKDGFELQFGTNHLGHFALTGLLLPMLQATPGARVVNLSSMGHRQGRMDFDDLNFANKRYSAMSAYCQSKLANLHFTLELDRRLKASSVDVLATASHPGWSATELQRHVGFFNFLNSFLAQSQADGALPTLLAAVSPDVRGGDYWGPQRWREMNGPPGPAKISAHALNDEHAARLWQVSQEMTGVSYL